MTRSLADLRADAAREDGPRSRPERATTICLAPDLVAEVQSLTAELALFEPDDQGDEQPSGPPKRQGQGRPSRAVEIEARLRELVDQMSEHEGEMRVRANLTDGEWRRWCNEHPARKEDEPGHDRDLRVTSGLCSADDLIDKLGDFVHSWDGEQVSDTDWERVFEPVVAGGDKNDLARSVVSMYENRVDFPQWRSALSSTLRKSSASASPEISASPTSASTAGSR